MPTLLELQTMKVKGPVFEITLGHVAKLFSKPTNKQKEIATVHSQILPLLVKHIFLKYINFLICLLKFILRTSEIILFVQLQ